MKTSELITRIMVFTDNVDATGAAGRQRRRRILQDIQEKFDEVWNDRAWRWSVGQATITVAAGTNVGLLPIDFGSIPKFGGVYVDGQPLHDLTATTMQQIQQGFLTGSNVGYSLGAYSTVDQRQTIEFDVDGPLTATIYYKKRTPLLADKPWEGYPSLAVGAAGVITGKTYYKQTYVTSDGFEHEDGPATDITPSAQQVTVTTADPGPVGEHNVTTRNTYRTISAGALAGPYYRIAATVDNTVVTDNATNAAVALLPVLSSKNPLDMIPSAYHTTVLLPGVRSMRKQSQGDTRDFARDFEKGLAKMFLEQRPFQNEVQQMPRVFPNRQQY